MKLIVGNFYGIQEYIFSNLKSKKSASILRGRSFDIYALMNIVADMIIREYNLEKDSLIFLNSGKFYIENEKEVNLDKIQKTIDSYFLENHLTNSGIYLFQSKLEDDFSNTLKNINVQKELKSFQKFSLWDVDSLFDKDYKEKAIKFGLCEQCEVRIKESEKEFCYVCDFQATIGEDLRIKQNFKEKEGFGYSLTTNKEDKNILKYIPYVPVDEKGNIKSFDEIASNSQNLLIAIKADIDNLGDMFFRCKTLKEFIKISNSLDNFMTIGLKKLLKNKNIYTIFSGGDDLFLIGEFCDILEFIPKFKKEFNTFSKNNLDASTISLSTSVVKNTTPINYIVQNLDKGLNQIKNEKNKIFIFDESINFDDYMTKLVDIENIFNKYLKTISKTTSFYYRLLEICNMKRGLDKNENIIKNSKWVSNLSYFFKRNIIDKVSKNNKKSSEEFLELIYNLVLNDIDLLIIFIKKEIYLKRMENNAENI